MKYIYLFFLIMFLFSCNKESLNCDFSGNKKIVIKELPDFSSVVVNPLIRLKIIDTNYNKIRIKADEDVIDNIDFSVGDNILTISNHTDCLIENSQAIADITLFVDEINEIVGNTDRDISSGNVLNFQNLNLICENSTTGNNNVADFNLDLQIKRLKIIANGVTIFRIKGNAQYMFAGFYGVSPTLLAKNFEVDTIKVFHRGSADMHIYPKTLLEGDLFGYGDIYLYHYPQIFNIIEHGRGHIYFVN